MPYGILSQVLASGTNFLVLVSLARIQGVDQFGWSALSIAAVTACVGISRSVFGTSIALAADSSDLLVKEGRFGTTVSAMATLTLTAPVACWSFATGQWTIFAIAIGSPLIVFHDTLRQVCFSGDRARIAMTSDLARFLLLTFVTITAARLSLSAPTIVGVWGGATALAAGDLAHRLHWRPFRGGALDHWRRSANQRYPLFGDSLLIQFTPVVTSILIGSALSAAALSAFRGGSTVLGPVSILLTAVPLLMLPRLVRESVGTFQDAFTRLCRVSVGLTGVCILISLGTLVAPRGAGELVLGDSWGPTRPILPVMALQFALQPWALSVSTSLKLVGRSQLLVPLRLVRSIGLVVVVAAATRTGSVLTVVTAILIFEAFATLGYLAVGYRCRNLQVGASVRSPTSSTGES